MVVSAEHGAPESVTVVAAGPGGARADKACAHPFEVLFRVDGRRRRAASDADDDPMSVPKRTQLLQRLEALDRRRRERWEMAQKGNPVGIKAVVAVQRHTGRNSF